MINRNVNASELELDGRELAARLGVPYGTEKGAYRELYNELIAVAKPAYAATRVKLNREMGGITVGNATSQSTALMKLSEGSSSCLALVATLGVGVDRLILKVAQLSASRAFIIDAMADALIEALCDLAEREICEGLETKPRFSPGYGDLELSLGKELVALSGADKTLGIRMTESGLMVPKKSVNALIIIKDE
ncbi:MAG: hypothetical protein IJW53_01720 [Clostridia bacterium]|nr:hypothetical protein [Clostridia bacterium]